MNPPRIYLHQLKESHIELVEVAELKAPVLDLQIFTQKGVFTINVSAEGGLVIHSDNNRLVVFPQASNAITIEEQVPDWVPLVSDPKRSRSRKE
jgi:hypothetical protein